MLPRFRALYETLYVLSHLIPTTYNPGLLIILISQMRKPNLKEIKLPWLMQLLRNGPTIL